MKGRKPKPLEVHEKNGNPSKKNLAKEKAQTPRAPDASGDAPEWLSVEALKFWARLCPTLQRMRVMTSADEIALAELCEQLVDLQCYRNEMGKLRETKCDLVEGSTGNLTLHPYGKALMQYTQIVRGYLTEFGLTPASRTRINIEPEKQADSLISFVGALN